MKFEFSRQIFEKVLNIKFYQNPSIWNRVVLCGQRDMKLIVVFLNFANVPENASRKVLFAFEQFFYVKVQNILCKNVAKIQDLFATRRCV